VTPEERARLEEKIDEMSKWYNRGSHWWSVAHYSSLYFAAGFSAASALLEI
jgi:hypothetical protein